MIKIDGGIGMVKVNFQETNELDDTTRGTGGFGSTNA